MGVICAKKASEE
jgi:serine/threonine protein kinase